MDTLTVAPVELTEWCLWLAVAYALPGSAARRRAILALWHVMQLQVRRCEGIRAGRPGAADV